jgi:hypothetical protein
MLEQYKHFSLSFVKLAISAVDFAQNLITDGHHTASQAL